jgi:hypothetical protein
VHKRDDGEEKAENGIEIECKQFRTRRWAIHTIDSEPVCPILWFSINWMGNDRGFDFHFNIIHLSMMILIISLIACVLIT